MADLVRGMRYAGPLAALLMAAAGVARGDCVSFEDAKKLEGKPACVTGKVVKVNQGRTGNWYLDFCANYRECTFTVYVQEKDAAKLGDLRALEGQQVEIYGKVQDYQGRAEIILRDKRQLDGEKSKYLPPEEKKLERSRSDAHSAELRNPPQHHCCSGGAHTVSKKSSSGSNKPTPTTSASAPPT